jgi:hypothetical protein
MDEFIGQFQYQLAWSVYITSGLLFCAFWWKLTSNLDHEGWRDLFRGIALVLIFTPWFAGESHETYAPAVMVVCMDLLLGSSDNGLAASLALLIVTALTLVTLILRRVRVGRAARGQQT